MLIASPIFANTGIIKARGNSTVYYLDNENVRHIFPTAPTYFSWYDDFSLVVEMDAEEISKYELGSNITVRPGVSIITFDNNSNIYAVEIGGVLRPFKTRDVIKQMYGDGWFNKVVKIPEVFFGDYTIGDEIKNKYNLPDGAVYKYEDGYFLKRRGIAWPFKDLDSVLSNRFKKGDIINTTTHFNERKKQITEFDDTLFNPIELPQLSTADCENKNLKVAFLFVSDGTHSLEDIKKIKAIKDRSSENFSFASGELAEINTDLQVVVLEGDLFYSKDGNKMVINNEAINTFYDTNDDEFDFIIIYNNFSVKNGSIVAQYFNITNDFHGTGNNNRHIASIYGSRGKLKGIASMGNINQYGNEDTNDLDWSVNFVIHEIMHHWSGRAKFRDDSGNISTALLKNEDSLDHWSIYNDSISPLGGSGWQDNGDGTFTNQLSLTTDARRKLSNLDLYFMGILPKQLVGPIKYLVPEIEVGNTVSGYMEEIDISQIISAMGKTTCYIL